VPTAEARAVFLPTRAVAPLMAPWPFAVDGVLPDAETVHDALDHPALPVIDRAETPDVGATPPRPDDLPSPATRTPYAAVTESLPELGIRPIAAAMPAAMPRAGNAEDDDALTAAGNADHGRALADELTLPPKPAVVLGPAAPNTEELDAHARDASDDV
jgi:hypothetical protein